MIKVVIIVVSLFCMGMLCSAGFEGKYREFEAKDGRVFTGRIIEGNRKTKKVRIELKSGKKTWVPINIFSEEESEYLKAWFFADDFLSNKNLMARITEKREAGEAVEYTLFLHNRGSEKYTGVKIEYCIYLENRRMGSKRNNSIKCFKKSLDVDALDAGSRTSKVTEAAPLEKAFRDEHKQALDANGNTYTKYRKVKISEDRPIGIWFRVSGPTVEGELVVRDVCYPPNLHKEFTWGWGKRKKAK